MSARGVPLFLFLAARALVRSRLTLVLLLLAVTAGVGFQIPNAANLSGYTEELMRQGVSRATGHLLLTPREGDVLEGTSAMARRLRRLPFVRGVTRRLLHAGVLFRQQRYRPTRVVGVEPAEESGVAGFCEQIAHGRCLAPGALDQAVVGSQLGEALRLRVGDRVKLVLPTEGLGAEVEFTARKLLVVGLRRGGGGFQSDHDIFISFDALGEMLARRDEASQVSLFVDDHRRAEAYVPRVAALAPGARVESWWAANAFVSSAITGNRRLFLISTVMVIFAVGIPVLALLYIHVLQDRKQIAILASLGFTRGALFAIYVLKAVLLGVAGVGLGVAGGIGLCAVFSRHPIFAYQGFVVRPAVNALVIALPSAILLGVTVLAGLAPAIKAARANPALELRED